MRKSIYNGANRFYVYAFLRKTDLTPFYIGKGSGKRAWNKRGRGQVQRPADNCRIIILQDNMSENDAFALEIERIKFYGRIDLGTGILRNRTDGGEGSSGRSGFICSQETRDRLSAAMSGANNPNFGRTHSQEARDRISAAMSGANNHSFGNPPSQETRDRISAAHTGRTHSQEHRDRISAAMSGANNHNFSKKLSPESIAKRTETRKKNRDSMLRSENLVADANQRHPVSKPVSTTHTNFFGTSARN